MKKKIEYTIEKEVAIALKKVTGKINDIEFRGTYDLTDVEMGLVHEFYDLVEDEDE